MARRRHQSKPNSSTPPRRSREQIHIDKVRFLTKTGKRPDPSNVRQVARQYAAARRRAALEQHYTKPATKAQRELLKKKGFFTTKKGVVIDGPRDAHRQKIKGSRFEILSDGTIKFSIKQRRDYIVGLTAKEKKQFAADPHLFTQSIVKRLREKYPSLKGTRPEVRLQWGAFQGTKGFSPHYFSKMYFAAISPEEQREQPRGKRKPRLDKLTGIHVVIHIPKKKAKRGRKRK